MGWMDAGTYIDTQQTQNKVNRDTDDLTGHNFDKGVGGGRGKLFDTDDEVGA